MLISTNSPPTGRSGCSIGSGIWCPASRCSVRRFAERWAAPATGRPTVKAGGSWSALGDCCPCCRSATGCPDCGRSLGTDPSGSVEAGAPDRSSRSCVVRSAWTPYDSHRMTDCGSCLSLPRLILPKQIQSRWKGEKRLVIGFVVANCLTGDTANERESVGILRDAQPNRTPLVETTTRGDFASQRFAKIAELDKFVCSLKFCA